MDDLKNKIGVALRKLRLSQEGKLSQEDIADYSGISTRYYCDLENGKKMPSIKVLINIARTYKLSLAELIVLLDI